MFKTALYYEDSPIEVNLSPIHWNLSCGMEPTKSGIVGIFILISATLVSLFTILSNTKLRKHLMSTLSTFR